MAASKGTERQSLRRALIDLCFERGLATITIEDLCRRAEVNRAAFERHFADLEDCFFQVYAAELERYRAEAESAGAGLSGWRDRLRATAYALYRFLAADDKIRHLTTVEVRGGGERVQLLIGEEMEALFDLIDEGRSEPGAPDSLSRATAESIGGGIFNQIYTMTGQGEVMPSETQIVPQMMYATVLPYLGPQEALEELNIPPPPKSETPQGVS